MRAAAAHPSRGGGGARGGQARRRPERRAQHCWSWGAGLLLLGLAHRMIPRRYRAVKLSLA